MDEHGADRHEIPKKSGDINSRSGINRSSPRWVQIMIQRNECRARKAVGALRKHRGSIPPNLQLEIRAERRHRLAERSDPLVVVFENEDGFHVTKTPFRSATPITACVPELNSRKSFSMPSLKMTPFSAMRDSRIKGVSGVTRPNTSDAPVVFVGNGSRTG